MKKVGVKKVFIGVSIIVFTFVLIDIVLAKEPDFVTHVHPHTDDVFTKMEKKISNADELVASKQTSDMTYEQMMQRMGEAYKMMQTGLINENKELIRIGAYMIQNHPAPKHKPWIIVKDKDVEDFKEALISYDKVLHESVSEIEVSLEKDDWVLINQKIYDLSNHCVSCHSVWKNNLK